MKVAITIILGLLLQVGVMAQPIMTNICNSGISVPSSALEGDKIKLQNNSQAQTVKDARLFLMKCISDSTVTADGYYVLISGGIEIVISGVVSFSQSDFPIGSMSQFKEIDLNFPAQSKIGTVRFKYREYIAGKWQAYKFANGSIQTTVGGVINDEYNNATVLTVGNQLTGTTKGSTVSPQAVPSCTYFGLTGDVWYRFTATSTAHTIKLTNVKLFGTSYGTRSAYTAVYNSSLNEINCSSNDMTTLTNLTVGSTYYVRLWVDDNNPERTMDFQISLSPITSGNVITKLSVSGGGYSFTANYTHDSSIPDSDIDFIWDVYPGEIEPASVYTIVDGQARNQITIVGGPFEGDTTVRLRVRMKRISTNEMLTDWFVYSPLIWFG